MLNIKNIETKIWTATTAICSSILTSILSDSITTSDFIVIEENNQIIIQNIPSSFLDLALNYSKLLLFFFIIWMILYSFRYVIERIYRKLRVRSIPQIKKQKLILILDELKKRTTLLYQGLENQPNDLCREYYVKMNMRELCSITLLFRKYFFKPDTKGQNALKNICRDSNTSSFISLTDRISPYELESILALLHLIINEAKKVETTDALFQKDYAEIEQILGQIQNIFQNKP